MSNVAGKAYGMTVITPMARRGSWLNRWIFRFARAFPGTLSGLIGLRFIHFARWVIIPKHKWPNFEGEPPKIETDSLLFISNFNGTWDQYIDAFSDGIPDGLDLFWYRNARYPGSVPITPFKEYIRANQINCDYYYNATPGAAQRDIVSALKLREKLIKLEKLYKEGERGEDFARAYCKMLVSVQNDLTTQGFAPLASIDLENAEAGRHHFEQMHDFVITSGAPGSGLKSAR